MNTQRRALLKLTRKLCSATRKFLFFFDALGNYVGVMETKLDKINVFRRTRRFSNLMKPINS